MPAPPPNLGSPPPIECPAHAGPLVRPTTIRRVRAETPSYGHTIRLHLPLQRIRPRLVAHGVHGHDGQQPRARQLERIADLPQPPNCLGCVDRSRSLHPQVTLALRGLGTARTRAIAHHTCQPRAVEPLEAGSAVLQRWIAGLPHLALPRQA